MQKRVLLNISRSDMADPFFCKRLVSRFKKRQPINDIEFDSIYPESVQNLSEMHWTSVTIARRAAELCVTSPGARVLDVGSGCGKFCIVGALSTSGIFVGVEQREHLVETARTAAKEFGIHRTKFISANMVDIEWDGYDSIYLFNPFHENLEAILRIDDLVTLSPSLYLEYILVVKQKLNKLKRGTRVVTLNGFGGPFPNSYHLIYEEEIRSLPLEVWEKFQ